MTATTTAAIVTVAALVMCAVIAVTVYVAIKLDEQYDAKGKK